MNYKHLLAINTVTGSCSVAIAKGVKILTQKTILKKFGYSEILMPLIQDALFETKLKISQLEGFLVCTGPGNYTSLRIATSAARGLSLACGKPACGISLFELFAGNLNQTLVLIKGPQDKIYTQKFSNGIAIASPKLMSFNEFQTTKNLLNFNTVGYQAKRIGELLGSKETLEVNDISFEKFFTLGLTKLNSNNPRPAPIYIK